MKFLPVAAAVLAVAVAMPDLAQAQTASRIQPRETPPAEQPAQAAGTVRPSKGALKPLVDLQTAVNGNDRAAIPALLAAAKAASTTKEDHYLVSQLQLKAALAATDYAGMAAAVRAIDASGYLDTARLTELYKNMGGQLFNAKQYPLGATMFERAVALAPSDQGLQMTLADIRLIEGRKAEAAAIYDRLIKARQAAGQKPEEGLYKRAVQAAYDAKLPGLNDLTRQWVTAYPGPESWRNSIAVYRNSAKPDLEGTLDLLRLMHATGSLTRAEDLQLYVEILADRSNFIEAQRVLDQAGAGGGSLQSLKSTVASKPKVTAAELTAASKSAQSGMALLRIGDRFFGLGEYAKAAEAYRGAKAKGVEAGLADLRTGIALARAGDKAGATAALKSVSGARAGVAQYWLLHLQNGA